MFGINTALVAPADLVLATAWRGGWSSSTLRLPFLKNAMYWVVSDGFGSSPTRCVCTSTTHDLRRFLSFKWQHQSVLYNGSGTVFTEVEHDDNSSYEPEAESISLWLCKEARKKSVNQWRSWIGSISDKFRIICLAIQRHHESSTITRSWEKRLWGGKENSFNSFGVLSSKLLLPVSSVCPRYL